MKLLLIINNIRGILKILQTLSYTVHSIFLPKFPTFLLFTLILDIPAIVLQTPCCHAVMTSKIPLEAHWGFLLTHVQFCKKWVTSFFIHISVFPSKESIIDLINDPVPVRKDIFVWENFRVTSFIKILSLLTSGQEKKCLYIVFTLREYQPLRVLLSLLFCHFNRSEPTYKSQRIKLLDVIVIATCSP